jgi:hypothetical protein
VDEPACVVVRGTIEQEPFAHGTQATIPSSAPFSLASYEEVMSGLPQDPRAVLVGPYEGSPDWESNKDMVRFGRSAMCCVSRVYLAKTI